MKKQYIHILTFALGASMLMVACAKEEQVVEEPQKEGTPTLITESLTATKEGDATKVGMTSGREFQWNAADQAAFTITNGGYEFAVSENYNGAFTVSYSGTREGYAVIPARFVKDGETVTGSYDGEDLTVCYPDNYDISGDVEDATPCYDNADGTHFIPFPMVAKSVSGNKSLTFYSIGALVRVQMNNIPAGTKNVYVTFNQTVTGEFTVVNPDTEAPYVEITGGKATTPSTVTIKVSNKKTGLAADTNITLYIPVPTTEEPLKISSSKKRMASIARNGGYSWTVPAILRLYSDTEFKVKNKNYIVAPGNLLATLTKKVDEEKTITWSFVDGFDPHLNTAVTPTPAAALVNEGDYQDSFFWNELYEYFVGVAPDPDHNYGDYVVTYSPLKFEGEVYPIEFTGYTKAIGKDKEGNNILWHVPSQEEFNSIIFDGTDDYSYLADSRDGRLACVRGNSSARYSKVRVSLKDSVYESYAYTTTDSQYPNLKPTINGLFLFPDGYVDQTDLTYHINDYSANSFTIGNKPIHYSSFEKMTAAGAIFLPCTGSYYPDSKTVWANFTSGYYAMSTSYYSDKWLRLIINSTALNLGNAPTTTNRTFSVRLVRYENLSE